MFAIKLIFWTFVSFATSRNVVNANDFTSPYGIQLCKLKCANTYGCDKILFHPSHLICYAEDAYEPNFERTEAMKFPVKVQRTISSNECKHGSRVFTSRKNNSFCKTERPLSDAFTTGHCLSPDGRRGSLTSPSSTRNISSELKDELESACKEGHLDEVKCVFSGGLLPVDTRLSWMRTPVMVAARAGQKEVFDHLFSLGCDLMVKDVRGLSVLHHACVGGNVDMVKTLTEVKLLDKEVVQQEGGTPLLAAASAGRLGVFTYLVAQGCDIKPSTTDGINALHLACSSGIVDLVAKILPHFGTECKTKRLVTPVMKAIKAGRLNVLDYLVKSGCNLSAVDNFGNGVLHIASKYDRMNITRKLLDVYNLSIEMEGHHGRTPYLRAVACGSSRVVGVLERRGCNKSVLDSHGNNALLLAASFGRLELVKKLLPHFGTECRNKNHETPVMKTVKDGHMDVFEYLVDQGCNLHAKNMYHNNILHYTSIYDRINMARILVDVYNVSIETPGSYHRTAFLRAALHNGSRVLAFLIQRGCNTSAVDDEGCNALHLAAYHGHTNICKELIERHGFYLNARMRSGDTPLACAAMKGHIDSFDFLLSHGADIQVGNKNNVLHVACYKGKVAMVTHILSQHFIDINAVGSNGRSPLMVVAGRGHYEVFLILVQNHARLEGVDMEGNTLFHHACKGGSSNIVRYLVNLGKHNNNRNKANLTPQELAKIH